MQGVLHLVYIHMFKMPILQNPLKLGEEPIVEGGDDKI